MSGNKKFETGPLLRSTLALKPVAKIFVNYVKFSVSQTTLILQLDTWLVAFTKFMVNYFMFSLNLKFYGLKCNIYILLVTIITWTPCINT